MIAALAACILAAPAGAQTKPYTVQAPTSASGGGDTLNVTFTNLAKTQQLGSANLTVPAEFSVLSASVSQGNATPAAGNILELRDLALQPKRSLTVTVVANVPCETVDQTFTWGVRAKQANDFSGDPGNDFELVQPSNLSTLVTAGDCGVPTLRCDAGLACDTSLTLANGRATLDVDAAAGDPGFLSLTEVGALDCLGYTELAQGGFAVDFIPDPGGTGRRKVVTATISKDAMNEQVENGAAHLEMCFGAPFRFGVKPGTPPLQQPEPGLFIGLLPDCGAPPCVSKRSKTGQGQGVIEVQAPDGTEDPRYTP